MSNSQFKECLRLVTAEENLMCSEDLQSHRQETLLKVFPKMTTILNIYMAFPIMNRETERNFLTEWEKNVDLSFLGRTIIKLLPFEEVI